MSDTGENGREKTDAVRILLAERDDVCAALLEMMPSGWQYGGYIVRRARSLAEALQEIARGGIDVVLLDVSLPDCCGLDALLRMRTAAVRVPIIVLGGSDDVAVASEMVKNGAQDYITKAQTDVSSLTRAIRYAIERSRAQQALAEEHARLRSVIDNIPDQVYLKDANSRFISVNPVTARFFGVSSPDELVGKWDFDFFPPDLARQFLEEEQALMRLERPCINREAVIKDSEGNTMWVLTTKTPLRDHTGKITGLLGINRDITERKAAEEALRWMNTELEQRVAERTSELRKAVTRLEANDRARSEFVSSVSHELKTPLASMKLEIANLLDGVVGHVSEAVMGYLLMLEADCQRMANTVEDILDLSRLESKAMRLNKARVLFDRILRQSAVALGAQARAKNIAMMLSFGRGLGFVNCDMLKTMRALSNIVGNAIKFTPAGGSVEVIARGENGALVAEILDNGIGIAAQHLARVAEKYFRADEHVGGVGLGLSIAKEILELHGGSLAIYSPPPGRDRGAMVSVSLPAAEPPVVMIASGDEPERAQVEELLRSCAYRTVVCANSDEAIELARRIRPDVGILDASPAGAGKPDLVLRAKADPDLRAMAFVAIDGGSASAARKEILAGLGIPILRRPWSEDDLMARIEKAIAGMSSSAPASS